MVTVKNIEFDSEQRRQGKQLVASVKSSKNQKTKSEDSLLQYYRRAHIVFTVLRWYDLSLHELIATRTDHTEDRQRET